tara:strand:+ start:306 stop:656 length:351 start_codon:yes stop_codon:yes gene_type:complete
MSFIQTTNNKGFYMEFESGFSISIQFGTMNYCSRRNMNEPDFYSELNKENKDDVKATSVEIMVSDLKTGECITNSRCEDTVMGWVGVDDVGKIIGILANAKSALSAKVMLGKILNK